MDMWSLKPGDRVRTVDGALAEVVSETEDGQWVRVRYLSSTDNPELSGTEDLCHEDDVAEMVEAEAAPG